MHPCIFLLSLILAVVQAATIPRLDPRADICGTLDSSCSDLPSTLFDTTSLNLSPPPAAPNLASLNTDISPPFGLAPPATPNLFSLNTGLSPPSGLTLLPAAPDLALSLKTDTDPGLQYFNNDDVTISSIEKNGPLTDSVPQFLQAFAAPMNLGPGADNAPTVDEKDDISLAPNAPWNPKTGGWKGFCFVNGINCKLCFSGPVGDTSTKRVCREAVLRQQSLCSTDNSLCISHDPTDDTTTFRTPPSNLVDEGWWGYCEPKDHQCAMCYLQPTRESTGCAPAVIKKKLTFFLPNTVYTSLCFKGSIPSKLTCIAPWRWVTSFKPTGFISPRSNIISQKSNGRRIVSSAAVSRDF